MTAFFKTQKNLRSETSKQTKIQRKMLQLLHLVGYFWSNLFLLEQHFPSMGIPRHDGELRLALREYVCFSASFIVCKNDRPAFLSDTANVRNLVFI